MCSMTSQAMVMDCMLAPTEVPVNGTGNISSKIVLVQEMAWRAALSIPLRCLDQTEHILEETRVRVL